MAAALDSGKVAGYGSDVLDNEPPPRDHVLLSAPNTIITSHVGSRTFESVQRQATMATQNLINFTQGIPPLAQANICPGKRFHRRTTDVFFVVDPADHNRLVVAAYFIADYSAAESERQHGFVNWRQLHGIRTHNAIKALHLDEFIW